MENEAAGTFDVKLAPIGAGDVPISTMSIDKTFHGDLQGTSVGQMLAFRSGIEGSAGYVAMERVTGTLAGRKGSFTLQHLAQPTLVGRRATTDDDEHYVYAIAL
jgi:hypothetical protein